VTETQPRSSVPPTATVPARFGPYRIVREVGRGGMGVVYLAEQEGLGRRVALKVLAARHTASSKALERFEREVRAVARLNDPNIVAIHDVGRVEGQPYFTMEYVEGRTLHDVLQDLRDKQRAPDSLRTADLGDTAFCTMLPEAMRHHWNHAVSYVVARIADALSHVHAHGVVHRDVKPKNILLARDGRVLLFDFGVARVDTEASMTISGEFVGTPFYVSPEQVDPPDDGVDERTDIYSLGVTLYEALTLEVPFDGESPQQIFKRISQREAKPLRKVNAQVPRDLETVCAMAMAKERGRRYQSAADFAADLRRFLELKPVFARPLGPLGRLTLWARRKPTVAALAASGVVLLLLAVLSWQQRVEIRAERTANALASFRHAQVLQQQGRHAAALDELRRARAGGYDQVAVSVAMVEALEGSGDDDAAIRELTSLRARRDLGAHAGKVALLAGDLGVERLRTPDAGLVVVRQAVEGGQLGDADQSYARALLAEDAEQALAALEATLALQPLHVRARASYGPTLLSLGRRDEAVRFAERMKAADPDDPSALLFSALANALQGGDGAAVRAAQDYDAARRALGASADEPLRAWARHLAVATQGSRALLHWVLTGQPLVSGDGPIDPPRVLVAISELLAGVRVQDSAGATRSLRFRLPPAVAGGYAKLTQALGAHGDRPMSGGDLAAVLELLDEALRVHRDGLRFLLRALWGQATRGPAAGIADLEQAARAPSMIAIERAALFALLRSYLAAQGTGDASAPEGAGSAANHLRTTLLRLQAVARIEPASFPLLMDATYATGERLMTLELALRWRRESPQTLPPRGLVPWLSDAESERVMRPIVPVR
jgi:serine/threonine protein kinase/tetratricopeptide (TPR) repeat protein